MNKTVSNWEKNAEKIYDGLKYFQEGFSNYWWVSEQRGLDFLLDKPPKDLRYSTIYFYSGYYKLEKIPSEYMNFLPTMYQKTSHITLGDIRVPNDIHIHNLYLEEGTLRTSPRNMVSQCYVADTRISMAHSFYGFHRGGKVGYSRYPDIDPLLYAFNSCYFTDCQIDACIGEFCILEGTKRGPFFSGEECYDSKKKKIFHNIPKTPRKI